MSIQFSVSVRNARLDAFEAAVGTSPTSGAAYDVVNTVTFSSGDVDSRTVRLVCTPR